MTEFPLIDWNGRRVRPWGERKRQTMAVAEAMAELGDVGRRRADRMRLCGAYLEFERLLRPATGEHQRRRVRGSSCKLRLCPFCEWRRSIRLYGQVCEAVGQHLESCPDDRLILLTLTMRNTSADNLSATLLQLTRSFRRLSDTAWFKRSVRGWFRSLEVTRNAARGSYHPHLHVLLVVPAAYFDPACDLYRSTAEWVQAWRRALRVKYLPVCDVRVIGGRGLGQADEAYNGLAEVTKYCTKPADWLIAEDGLRASWRAEAKIVAELTTGLRSKRLVGWGGVLRELHCDPEQADNVPPADVLDWRDLPPGWVIERREAYNFRDGADELPADFYRVRTWPAP